MADQLELWSFTIPDYQPEQTIQERFTAFHYANPWVYEWLRDETRRLKTLGHQRVGIGMLFEVLRWNWMQRTVSTDGFKLNNDYRSRYARLIMFTNPDLTDVYETRHLRAV